MGRIAEAVAAGRRAVAQAETRTARAQAGAVHALLAPEVSDAVLAQALAAFRRMVGPVGPGVLICDRLPPDGAGARDLGFEHLSPMADLLAAAPPGQVLEHQVRRLQIILARRDVAECHWIGDLSGDLVRQVLRSRAARGPLPGLAPTFPLASGLVAGPARDAIFRPLAVRD